MRVITKTTRGSEQRARLKDEKGEETTKQDGDEKQLWFIAVG
jgi:hypothetical protein